MKHYSVEYIDRVSKKREVENVYGAAALRFIYGEDLISHLLGWPLLHALIRYPFFSSLYGWWQNLSLTKRKIRPFVETFHVDLSEFQKSSPEEFRSFNDFFTRKLRADARLFDNEKNIAIIPADGRYLFYQNIKEADGFVIKGEKFDLETLIEDPILAARYSHGTMVIARLCPSDYHRYHFPCDCVPGPSRVINGWLYSVNPIAVKRDIHIFTQNKRAVCELQTECFGNVLFLEIGATNVGSINDTYTANQFYPKGAEKGFFAFGASSLILLFEPGRIILDEDLVAYSSEHVEVKCLMGQSMGRVIM